MRKDEPAHDGAGAAAIRQPAFPTGRDSFDPPLDSTAWLWRHVVGLLDDEREQVARRPVSTPVDLGRLRSAVESYDFDAPTDPGAVIGDVAALLRDGTVHTTHPRYFGLFNPTPTLLGVVGETLAAAFNPQLAAWSHAPAAAEIEAHLLRFLGRRLGYPAETVAGSFTSGGAEANLTAVLLALTKTWPEYGTTGLRALPGRPVLYASAESHLAWLKIAHATGIGREAVRLVPVDADLRMDLGQLAVQVASDRAAGDLPFMVIGTAGTTGAGVLDPLPELAELCQAQDLWLHADAAYGGAAALSDRLRGVLKGIERAQSITVDAHKWLSVPMGAGALLCTDREALAETFRVTTSYMPADIPDTVDPYTSSQQWSRRFIGLKLFLSLAVAGRSGYADQLERDTELADILRRQLTGSRWTIANDTPLPVVCFADPAADSLSDSESWEHHNALARSVVDSGRAWISTVRLNGRAALRACVISFRTSHADIDELVHAVNHARSGPTGPGSRP
ncbi:pyridoxal-dependent decarboxylase [Streptomyces sp. HC44]|uniref:Pyridoxal-dependent decarboxylase n=1 Tax=Streptomyces scabichelini TaxID=2711217 RepID=A0A6G4V3U0_9ACTN|nr:pyridoxal-dependent decarboxylase [Streptomyces scabichelini]NGO08514.1 pyridoxal-dependent decarboxylase [Streptomyces scabichelini]